MIETPEIRRRVHRLIERSRQAADERRDRAAEATRQGDRVLMTVVGPMFRRMAEVLKAEGLSFQVSTPAGAVRMSTESSGDSYIELALDTASDPPVLRGRVSRTRGRRVLVDDRVMCEGDGIGELTEEHVLDFLVSELAPFVER